MRNRIISIIGCLMAVLVMASFSSGSIAEKDKGEKTGWQEAGLKGKVKSIREYRAESKYGVLVKGRIGKHIEYDSKGNKIEESKYNSDGSLLRKETYKYDSNGNKIEKCSYKSDGSLDQKVTNKFDSNGNKIEEFSYNSDGSLFRKLTYKYDAKGNVIELCKYSNEDEILTDGEIHEFDYYED